jgi:hypothetical protein
MGIGAWMVAVAACSGEPAGSLEAAGPTARDSAGIEIVENVTATWGPGEAWSITAEPELALGALDGPESALFDRVRGPALRRDGALVLANSGTNHVRAFDSEGRLLWQAGGTGAGPGEFESLRWVGLLPGDSVVVYDSRNRRTTVFAPDGSLGRTYSTNRPNGARAVTPVAVLAGGRILATGGVSFVGDEGPASELVWPDTPYYLTDLVGTVTDSIVSARGGELLVLRDAGSIGVVEPPLARTGFIGARADRIVVGNSQVVDLDVRSAAGTPLRRIRLALDAPRPAVGDLERALEAQAGPAAAPEAVRTRLRQLADLPLPDHYPLADEVLLEADGTVWLRIWRPPWEAGGPVTWRVFDPSGAYLGEVELPPGFYLRGVYGDRLVGVHRDAFDVEQVRVYGLIR